MKNLKYLFLSMLLIGFMACDDDDDNDPIIEPLPALSVGDLDFSNYISVGASFTAGFTDGALFIAAQQNSFPNMLAGQFAQASGGGFSQPLMNDNVGGFVLVGNLVAAPRMYFDAVNSAPVTVSSVPTTELGVPAEGAPFNNMGVPGLKSIHLEYSGYAALNPYFGRMASSPTATVLGDAVAQAPTFFTLSEIGGNDVLSYATSGGTGVDQTGNLDPSTYGGNDITAPQVFADSFSAAVDALTANGAKGVVANVPYITSLAHFTTVPYNPIPMDEATAAAVNQAYAQYNGGLQLALSNGIIDGKEVTKRTIAFTASEGNAVVLIDEDLTDLSALGLPNYRQATAEDLLVLPAMSFVGTLADQNNPLSVNGVAIPLADKWVLTPEEQTAIKEATDAYNTTISAVAADKNLALIDFKAILEQASTTGISYGNFNLTTAFASGGLISLDGIHLTARGYAVLANEMMKVIDATYGSNFEASGNLLEVGNYPTHYPASMGGTAD